MVKLVLWCITIILMFFLPNGLVNAYGMSNVSQGLIYQTLCFHLHLENSCWCYLQMLKCNNEKRNPNVSETFAGSVSRFGSGLFLLIQVVILLDFTHNWNAAWVAKDEQFW